MSNEVIDETDEQLRALAVMNDLHRAGFSGCWLESVTYFTGGLREGQRAQQERTHHTARVVIDQTEITGDRFRAVLEIAERHNADVGMHEVRMNQQAFTRLTVWPHTPRD